VRAATAFVTLTAAALTACTGATSAGAPAAGVPDAEFSLRPFSLPTIQSPLQEVESGAVRAVIPSDWDARPLPSDRLAREGFVASPHLDVWGDTDEVVQGMEAFWIDGAQLSIPSDYYYLAARSPAVASFTASESCRPIKEEVIVDHLSDVTGVTLSPGDFVIQAWGTCGAGKESRRWAYVVVAPGFGPARQVGIPNSGLYVVIAVVSAHRTALLDEMMLAASFGDSALSDLVNAARLQ
jgi:hypothetical protein